MAFKWIKKGLIFNVSKHPSRPAWMSEYAQAPSALVYDDFVRVYFSSRPPAEADGNRVTIPSFVDLDRRDLTKILRIGERPILELGQLGSFDEFGIYPVSVARFQDRILCFYAGWSRKSSVPFDVSIGMAESFDGGVTFQKAGPGPVLTASMNEPFIISGPKIRVVDGRLWLTYIAGDKWIDVNGKPEPVYKIREAWSDNGIIWTKSNRNLIRCNSASDEAQASPDVFFWEGHWHMLFCYRDIYEFRGKNGGYRIGHAQLVGDEWVRDDSFAGITVGSDEDFDSEMINYPHALTLDEKLYLFYTGNCFGKDGFGMAELQPEESGIVP